MTTLRRHLSGPVFTVIDTLRRHLSDPTGFTWVYSWFSPDFTVILTVSHLSSLSKPLFLALLNLTFLSKVVKPGYSRLTMSGTRASSGRTERGLKPVGKPSSGCGNVTLPGAGMSLFRVHERYIPWVHERYIPWVHERYPPWYRAYIPTMVQGVLPTMVPGLYAPYVPGLYAPMYTPWYIHSCTTLGTPSPCTPLGTPSSVPGWGVRERSLGSTLRLIWEIEAHRAL